MSAPPNTDTRAEAAILGAILLDPSNLRRVRGQLERTYFYADRHKQLWDAYLSLAAEGDPIDTLTVTRRLKEHGTYKSAGGSQYLVTLSTIPPVAANVEAYATIIRELSVVRAIAAVALNIHETLIEPTTTEDRSALVDDCQRRLMLATKPMTKRGGLNAGRQTIGQIAKELYLTMERSIAGEDCLELDITTTFASLDRKVRIPVGALTCIAGEPGSGKSSLARGMCMAWETDHGRKPHYVKTEDRNMHTVIREVASRTGLTGRQVRDCLFSRDRSIVESDVLKKVTPELLGLLNVGWTVEDTPGLTVEAVAIQCRDAVHEGADTIVIDTFTRIRLPNWRNASTVAKVDHNIEILASLATELGVPFLVLAHLKRIPEDRMPSMSDIRDSGNWENNCRLILIPHRRKGSAVIVIAKSSHDEGGAVPMTFLEAQTTWTEPGPGPAFAATGTDPTAGRY